MKYIFATTALLSAAACTLSAQTPSMTCERQGNGSRPGFCEIRETTIGAEPLSIDGNDNGGISVKGGDRADVLVRAMVQSQGDTDSAARSTGAQVIVHTSGGAVRADGPTDGHWSVSYEILVPRGTNLTLKTKNGGVSVAGVESSIEFHAVNGGVSLKDVGGSIHGETVNGGLSVTFSGARLTGQGMDVSTTNGGVSIRLPEQFSALLDVETTNGGLNVRMPNAAPVNKNRHVSMTLGAGGPLIRARTQNGGVSIASDKGKA